MFCEKCTGNIYGYRCIYRDILEISWAYHRYLSA